MRPSPLLLAALLLGCSADAPERRPVDPEPVVARILATLDEAARLDRDHHGSEAASAWRRAHAAFERDIEPALRARWSAAEVAETEYLFGRIRAELDQARGAPTPAIRTLRERLQHQIALPEADPGES